MSDVSPDRLSLLALAVLSLAIHLHGFRLHLQALQRKRTKRHGGR